MVPSAELCEVEVVLTGDWYNVGLVLVGTG